MGCHYLVKLEVTLLETLHFLVLCNPLVLHLDLQVLANFEVFCNFVTIFEGLLHKERVNILEVNSTWVLLISFDFVDRKHSQDVSVLDNDLSIVVGVV